MPKNDKKPCKYSDKSEFTREKRYVNSEADIEKQDTKSRAYKETRAQERQHNLRVANNEPITKATSIEAKRGPVVIIQSNNSNPPLACKCGQPSIIPWFSPNGDKVFLCNDCYDNIQ